MTARHAGLLLPLFSTSSTNSWGIGELPDVVPLSDWLVTAGLDRLMLLPLGTMPEGETSPYSASSSMAIDPIYIAVPEVEDFHRAGGIAALGPAARRRLEAAVLSPAVRYVDVRRAKRAALDVAFAYFLEHDWVQRSVRADELVAFARREAWWLDDYALFQVLAAEWPGLGWRQWPEPIRERQARALAEAKTHFERQVLREQYAQWIADEQWLRARRALAERGVSVIGDLPFVAAFESADVWSRADEYLVDVSVGAPPDAFSETGQDWQLPGYRWDVVADRGYELMRMRAGRAAELYDGIRIDHLVGLYRTYNRLPDGSSFFIPNDESSQLRQGEAVLEIFKQTGVLVLAEDLGTVPDFVRVSMARLGVPGTKVMRWERMWEEPGQPFIDPERYPEQSVAMTGTHDTETLAVWWERASREERRSLLHLPALQMLGLEDPAEPWGDRLRDGLLALAWQARSSELFVPFQDLFGWPVRINTPGTINESNWTWRLPWPVDTLARQPEAAARAEFLRALSIAAGRGPRPA